MSKKQKSVMNDVRIRKLASQIKDVKLAKNIGDRLLN